MAKKSRKKPAHATASGSTAGTSDTPFTKHAKGEPPLDVGVPVVGIGASAGGLDALTEFFDAMPDAPDMAFVVIQHLDPTKSSLVAELLDRHTKMEVTQVEDDPHIAPNRVYVIPPGKYLSIAGGTLHLSEPDRPRGVRTAIDYFLRSLAEDQNQRAVGVILSGTGTDGSLGVKAIKTHGGLVIAQSPISAAHGGMPISAIATGAVDHILAPNQMPNVLIRYAEHAYVRESTDELEATRESPEVGETANHADEVRANGLRAILALVRDRTQHDFHDYKEKTLVRRTRRRMCLLRMDEFSDYLEYLRRHSEEVESLVKDLLITVTDFFRDTGAWQTLEERLLPQLVDSKEDVGAIRAWLPGCATGEEPYSLAMLLLERLQIAKKACPLTIFASDVDRDALDFARQGRYPSSIEADVSRERLQRFFVRSDENFCYRVSKTLREAVVFAEQNLIADPPFSKLDLICCRNLLIYLKPEIQEKIVALFHFALADGGYLFLGNSETLGRHHDLFQTVDKRWRIFRKVGRTRFDRLEIPITAAGAVRRGIGLLPEPPPRDELRMSHLTQQYLLDWLSPSAVLVDDSWRIVYVCGNVDDYLTHTAGLQNDNLLDKCRRGLRTKLRGAVHKALQEKQTVIVPAKVERQGQQQFIRLVVRPVQPHDSQHPLVLVVFDDGRDREVARELAGTPGHARSASSDASRSNKKVHKSNEPEESDVDGDMVIRQLEEELAATRGDLQSTIEQVETSNEELKASNEEVMSINEELQSTNEELETNKEELQSLNEELNTVNNQLASKVDELETKHADLQNLISATDVATICLDNKLRIRWFTPAARKLIRLGETDEGRPLSDFAHDFAADDLADVAQRVLDNLVPQQAEVPCRDDRYYLRRVTPYRAEDHRIGGVVFTFVEITELKKSEEALKHSEQQLRFVIDSLPAVVIYIDQEARYRFFNHRLCEWFNLAPGFVQGRTAKEIMGEAAFEAVRPKMEKALAGQPVRYETELPSRHGGTRYVEVTYTPDILPNGAVDGYIGLMQDITARKHAESQLKALNESLEDQVAARVQSLGLLQDIAIAANEAKTIASAIEAALRRMCEHNPWIVGHAWFPSGGDGHLTFWASSGVWFFRSQPRNAARSVEKLQQASAEARMPFDQGFVGRAVSEGPPLWLEDLSLSQDQQRGDLTQYGLHSALVFPVKLGGETLAVLELFADQRLPRDEQLLEVVPAIGLQLAHVIERKRLEQEIAEATAELQRRLGRELHDSVSQELSGIGMIAQSLRASLEEQSSPHAVRMGELVKHLRNAHDQVRRLSRGLMPVEVDAHGLRAALEELAESCQQLYSVHCEFHCQQPVTVEDNDAAMHAYRIAQEAVHNAIKHSQPTHIDITLGIEEDRVVLTVSDNGGGFKERAKGRRGSGHRIMQYRANLIGADLEIESREGRGVVVTCRMRRKA